MPAIPIVTAPDFSGYARMGEQIGDAVGSIGKAYDAYEYVKKIRDKEATRKQLRQDIIDTFHILPTELSKNTPIDDLERQAAQLTKAIEVHARALSEGVATAQDQVKFRLGAMGDEKTFDALIQNTEEAIKAKRAEKEKTIQQTEGASQLRQATADVRSGFEAPSVTSPAREISQEDWTNKFNSEQGIEPSRETAARSFQRNVPNLESAGKENIDMALAGFRTQTDIDREAADKKNEATGGRKPGDMSDYQKEIVKSYRAAEQSVQDLSERAKSDRALLADKKSTLLDKSIRRSPEETEIIQKEITELEKLIKEREPALKTAQSQYKSSGKLMRADSLLRPLIGEEVFPASSGGTGVKLPGAKPTGTSKYKVRVIQK